MVEAHAIDVRSEWRTFSDSVRFFCAIGWVTRLDGSPHAVPLTHCASGAPD